MHTLHYLDYFLILDKIHSGIESVLQEALHISEELIVPIAAEKVKGPLPLLHCLGISLDSDKMELRLPPKILSQL